MAVENTKSDKLWQLKCRFFVNYGSLLQDLEI